jgi:hypothetical protein
MDNKTNLEEAFNDLFKGGTTSTGEEELLRVASKYSMQLTTAQMKCLLYLKWWGNLSGDPVQKMALDEFCQRWLELKEYNNSASFIMRVIDFISLRRFLTEQSFKVDIQK